MNDISRKIETKYIKDFDKWIVKKKDLHNKIVVPPLFNERDFSRY